MNDAGAGVLVTVDGRAPSCHESAWIAPTAAVSGSVSLAPHVSVWYGASVRGDLEDIEIGRSTNVQDCCALHADAGSPLRIGESVSVGHGAVLHGCMIGDRVLIGMSATVMNRAKIGSDSILAAGALVTEGTLVPPGSLVLGSPAKVVRAVTAAERRAIVENAATYVGLADAHACATTGVGRR